MKSKTKTRANTYFGPDWYAPPPAYLDEYGKMRGERSVVADHLCVDPERCKLAEGVLSVEIAV